MNDYQKFIFLSRYSRWNDEAGRRETWEEAVSRYCNFWKKRFGDVFPFDIVYNAIHSMKVMPSMRALFSAGDALNRDNVAGYNCSYVAVDSPRAFDEILYLLMCAAGVGFSVEQKYISKLPEIAESFHKTETTIVVSDSRIGWASAFRELISLLYSGKIPKIDVSKVRPAGSILKTFGGRASGPDPLLRLFNYTINLFTNAAGRKLTSLECHDLICNIASVVVVGGVRRSALISLSDLSDERLRQAKVGNWWDAHVYRALANNSAVYEGRPDFHMFLSEWISLYESRAGERGIFNRLAANKQANKSGRRDCDNMEWGTNPCGEIILRPNGFCNLTEVVLRPDDTFEDIAKNVELATILGTFQSTLTDFRYIRSVWKRNADDERLLGVSFTGIMDHPVMRNVNDSKTLIEWLKAFREIAISTNRKWAERLGISHSAAITCVKPSGTVSQLVGCSSGIHPAFAETYIRSVRGDNNDPLTKFLIDQGVYHEKDITNPENTTVFFFPQRAPKNALCVNDVTPIYQLNLYKIYREHWCEHNPSITVYYNDDNFMDVGAWVWKNFDDIGGVSFLPQSDHVYQQAPYVKTETYRDDLERKIDWSALSLYDKENLGYGGFQEIACTSGVCEL